MTGLADLIKTIWDAVAEFVLPFEIVEEWEHCARVRNGRIVRTYGAGWRFYWPVIETLYKAPATEFTIQTDEQTLTTADTETVVACMTMICRISDYARYLRTLTADDDDGEEELVTIKNRLEASIGRVVPELEWFDDNSKEDWSLATNMVREVRTDIIRKLTARGIEIIELSPHTLARVRAYRVIT